MNTFPKVLWNFMSVLIKILLSRYHSLAPQQHHQLQRTQRQVKDEITSEYVVHNYYLQLYTTRQIHHRHKRVDSYGRHSLSSRAKAVLRQIYFSDVKRDCSYTLCCQLPKWKKKQAYLATIAKRALTVLKNYSKCRIKYTSEVIITWLNKSQINVP